MHRLLLSVVLTLLASPAFASGWTATQVSRMEGGTGEDRAQMRFAGGRLRIDAGEKSYIIEMKTGQFTFLDHTQKVYATANLAEIVELQKRLIQAMKAQVPRLPPKMRATALERIAQLEKSAKGGTKPEISRTGKKDVVNGYDCEVVKWKDDFGDNEACIATKLPVDMKPFLKDSAALADRLAKMGASNATPTQALFHLPGFPVRTVRKADLAPGQVTSTTLIEGLKKLSPKKDTFAVPKAYQQRPLQDLIAPGM